MQQTADETWRTSFWTLCRRVLESLVLTLVSFCPGIALSSDEVVFGYYDEFTLYKADEGVVSDDVLLVFHGFASAMPNGAYKDLHEKVSQHFTVIGFNYDYFDLEANDAAMDLISGELLEGRNVVFAGTSLGGFWANYYAERYNVDRVVLVNPVVNPSDQLRQFIGDHYIEKRQLDLTVTNADVQKYKPREAHADPNIKRLIILSKDDEILDFSIAVQHYSGTKDKLFVFENGGHTLDLGEERFVVLLRDFLLQ